MLNRLFKKMNKRFFLQTLNNKINERKDIILCQDFMY